MRGFIIRQRPVRMATPRSALATRPGGRYRDAVHSCGLMRRASIHLSGPGIGRLRTGLLVTIVGSALLLSPGTAWAGFRYASQLSTAPGPDGVGVDTQSGDVYVATWGDHLQKFSPSGAMLWDVGGKGSGAGQFNGAEGAAVDPMSGDVYVVDYYNNRVEKFSSSGAYLTQIGGPGAGAGQLNGPQGVAVNPRSDTVYVTDASNHRVAIFSSSGMYLSQFGGWGSGNGQFSDPEGVAVDPQSGDVYVTDGSGVVQKFSSSGAYLSRFGSSGSGDGQFTNPGAIAVDPSSGDVYVTDFGNHRVQKFSSSGDYLSQFGSNGSGSGQFQAPAAVAVDPMSGDVYVGDFYSGSVQKFTGSDDYLSSFGSSGSGNGQFTLATSGEDLAVAVDPSTEDVYVTDGGDHRVEKFDATGGYLLQFGSNGSGSGQFDDPEAVAVDRSSGDVYVSDYGHSRIEKFSSAGTYLSQFGSHGSGNGQFDADMSLAVDPSSGDVYVADTEQDRIEKFSSAGGYLSQFGTYGSGDGQFNRPTDMAVDPATGDLYVADVGNARIEKFSSTGTYVSQFAGHWPGDRPVGVAVEPGTGNVYVFAASTCTIVGCGGHVEKFSSSGLYLSSFGSGGSATGSFDSAGKATGLATDPAGAGHLYVGDELNYRIEKFGPPSPPSCSPVSSTTGVGQPVRISFKCAGAAAFPLSYQTLGSPAHGVLSAPDMIGGAVTYTPTPGYSGTDSFSYRAANDGGPSAAATVTITVSESPSSPPLPPSSSSGLPPSPPSSPPPSRPSGLPPQPQLSLIGHPRAVRGGVTLRLRCAGGTCNGLLTLTTTVLVRFPGRSLVGVYGGNVRAIYRHGRIRLIRRILVVGYRRFSIAAGDMQTITVSLNATGRRLLARFHKLPVKLIVRLAVSYGLGRVVAVTATIVLKPQKKQLRKERPARRNRRSRDVLAIPLM